MGLSTYCILEKDALVPNLVETKEDASKIWSMYFDGSRNKNGAGASVMLISPTQVRYYSPLGSNSISLIDLAPICDGYVLQLRQKCVTIATDIAVVVI